VNRAANVNPDKELVERIVQEVIRRLTAGGWTVSAQPVTGAAVPASQSELVLQERLVTLATLQGRLAGVTRVIVPRRAVVSPAARDELRAQSIELERN
jgi:hypothetical protein